MTRDHASSAVRGVGPADKTGKSLVRYCPGGTRPASAPCLLPRKPRVVAMSGHWLHRGAKANLFRLHGRRPKVLVCRRRAPVHTGRRAHARAPFKPPFSSTKLAIRSNASAALQVRKTKGRLARHLSSGQNTKLICPDLSKYASFTPSS